jgi:hypothetical protein
MIVLPTAKVLLFIALNLGPHDASLIYATSNSESYVWTPAEEGSGWTVEAKGFPASDFSRDPSKTETFSGNPTANSVPAYLRAISHHKWRNNTMMIFDNGDRVEKHGDHAFYIVNAGGANEKVFTILYQKKKPE